MPTSSTRSALPNHRLQRYPLPGRSIRCLADILLAATKNEAHPPNPVEGCAKTPKDGHDENKFFSDQDPPRSPSDWYWGSLEWVLLIRFRKQQKARRQATEKADKSTRHAKAGGRQRRSRARQVLHHREGSAAFGCKHFLVKSRESQRRRWNNCKWIRCSANFSVRVAWKYPRIGVRRLSAPA